MRKLTLHKSTRRLSIFPLFSFMFILINSQFILLPQVSAMPTTTMYVDPTSITTSASFTVSINVTDVDDLYGWEFKLNYTTSILTASSVTEGSFLANGSYLYPYLWISDNDDFVYQVNYSNPAAAPITSWDTGTTRPYGVEYVNGYIYYVDYSSTKLYNMTLAGSKINEWSTAGYSGDPYGLGWNGTHFFIADPSDDQIYIVDPADPTTSAGSITYTNIKAPNGVTFDGTYLWVSDVGGGPTPATIYQIDYSGNIQTSWSPPASAPTGITWDGTYLWISDSGNNEVYKYYTNGTQIVNYTAPSGSTQGLSFGKVSTTPSMARGTFFSTIELSDANGRVWLTGTLLGDVPGVTGGGILANITFTIDGSGNSPLDLHDTYLVGRNFINKSTYYITHTAVDGSVTVPAVPEFPLGVAMEIGLIAVVIYVWWRKKTKIKPQTLPK